MKSMFVAITLAVSGLALSLAPGDVDAKRLGGGKPAGMQRQAPPAQQPGTPANNAATQNAPVAGAAAPAAAGAAAAAGKRSWMGPIAGIAAGLGIAALLSHFGMGEGLANMMTMLLMAAAAFFVIRWLLRRFGPSANKSGGLQMAGAGNGAMKAPWSAPEQAQPMQRNAIEPIAPAAAGLATAATRPAVVMPEGFDAQDFERIAKMIFIRLQAANDSGQVDDLRKFTTPELFASLRLDLQNRGSVAQQTDVLQLDAKVVDTAQEDGQWIVTVRFSGLIREQAEAGAEPFRELWNLVKPIDGNREWAIAGITPEAA